VSVVDTVAVMLAILPALQAILKMLKIYANNKVYTR
jgi:hypothetical protein